MLGDKYRNRVLLKRCFASLEFAKHFSEPKCKYTADIGADSTSVRSEGARGTRGDLPLLLDLRRCAELGSSAALRDFMDEELHEA